MSNDMCYLIASMRFTPIMFMGMVFGGSANLTIHVLIFFLCTCLLISFIVGLVSILMAGYIMRYLQRRKEAFAKHLCDNPS